MTLIMVLIAGYWLLSSLVGCGLTGRNLRLAWLRWRILVKHAQRESLCLTAFVTVRSDAIRLYQHLCYLALGVRAFAPQWLHPLNAGTWTLDLTALHALNLPPTIVVPLTFDIVLALFLMIPTLLIVATQTSYADSERALALEKL